VSIKQRGNKRRSEKAMKKRVRLMSRIRMWNVNKAGMT